MDPRTLPWPSQDPMSGAVRLRPFDATYEDTDVAMVRDLATDPYLPLVSTLPLDADESQARAYLSRQRGRHAEGRGFMFAIARRADRSHALGFAALWLRDVDAGRGSIGYGVAPAARGHGVAADAARALLAFAWTLPGLHRVEAYVEPWNSASLRTCEAAGLTREGLLRKHQSIGGELRDMVLYTAVRA